MSTPAEMFDAYEAAAARLPWPWRWWYLRRARLARKAWDRRRDEALVNALKDEARELA